MNRDSLATRLLATFVDELEEQLITLNEDLLALETEPANVERLRSVFRVAHTLKGAARAANVPHIEEASHALETVLAGARDGKTPLTPGQIELMFSAADTFADAGHRLRAGEPLGDLPFAELIQRAKGSGSATQGPRRGSEGAVQRPTAVQPSPEPIAPIGAQKVESQPDVATAPANPVAASVIAASHDEQVRIAVRKLDALIVSAGEALVASGAIEDRIQEVDSLHEFVTRWRDEWRRTGARQRGILRAAGVESRTLAALDAVDGRLRQLDLRAAQLAIRFRGSARALTGTSARFTEGVRRLRMRPFGDVCEPLPRLVRDVATSLGKDVGLELSGQDIEADRTVLESLREPLAHLVRNAVDHGIESRQVREANGKPERGVVSVGANLRGDTLVVTVADDGAGLQADTIRAVLRKRGVSDPTDDDVAAAVFEGGLSTKKEATAISGRGVGLDIVRATVERAGGGVSVAWQAGRSTTFTIEMPITFANIRAILVTVTGQTFAIPSGSVDRIQKVAPESVRQAGSRRMIRFGQDLVPLASMAQVLGPPLVEKSGDESMPAIILSSGRRRAAIAVDEVIDESELVVRSLEHAGQSIRDRFAGGALLPNGHVALVLNVAWLVPAALSKKLGAGPGRSGTGAPLRRNRVLVVDDSITTRTLEESVLSAAGLDVVTAVDGVDGWRIIQEGNIDLVISDVEMPRMDGLALCETIRASERFRSLPVVLVTSLDKPEHRERGLEAGADAYIAKGTFDQDILLATARRLLSEER